MNKKKIIQQVKKHEEVLRNVGTDLSLSENTLKLKNSSGAEIGIGVTLPKGEKGEDGVTPNITVGTVTTLEAGQQATVVNSGTKENPIFDFGIPKGENGSNGERGEQGANGKSVELTKTTTHIKWRYAGQSEGVGWTDLVALEDIKGETPDMTEFENRITEQLDTIANKGTTVEVLERVTKEEIERQIADGTMANLTIADGSITKEKLAEDIEFGVADGSITLEKLDASIFGVTYILQGVEKTWLSYNFIKLSQKYSNCKLRIKFDYTPNNDTFFKISTNKFSSEATSRINVSANVKTTIDKEIELIGTNTFDIIKLETSISELKSFDGTIENIVIAIDDNNINYEVLEPSIGTCKKDIETDITIANKTYVNNKINEAKSEILGNIEDNGISNISKGAVTEKTLHEDVVKMIQGESYENSYNPFPQIDNYVENSFGVIALDKKIYGKRIKSLVQEGNNTIKIGIAKKVNSHEVEIIEFKEVGESWKPGIYEVNIDIPSEGGYLVFDSNFTSKSSEHNIRCLKLESLTSGAVPVTSVVNGYKYLNIEIEKCNTVDEMTNKINKIETDMSLKSNMYDLSIPVSINQIDNLKLVFSEDFTEENINFNYVNCSYGSSDGITMVANSKIEYKYDVAVDTFRQKFIVKVLDKNSTFGITTSAGANFMVDCSNNKIISTIKGMNGTETTKVDIDFNIEINKYYILEVIKDGLNHNFTIYDKSTSKRTKFSKVVMYSWGVGVVGFKCDTGSVKVLNYKYFQALFKNPLAIFIGDSITEGISMGTYDISKRWCSLIRDNYFKGNALIFGKGYDTSSGALTRLNNLYRQGYTSKYVFIMIGTNESGSDTALASWKENIVKIYDLIISNNAMPIIITPPLSKTNVDYIVQMKDFIQEKGWNTIRMDLALSVNNDGITYDNQYYQDGTHPNVQGGQLMYERALFDLDMIM